MMSHHIRFRPFMWAMIGIALFGSLTVAMLQLDSTLVGYIAGGLLFVCVLTCVVAYWLDARSDRSTP